MILYSIVPYETVMSCGNVKKMRSEIQAPVCGLSCSITRPSLYLAKMSYKENYKHGGLSR